MIIGIGCDLTDLKRWQQEEWRNKLVSRFFTPEEQSYVQSRGRAAAESAGGIFAAKEALVKALGTGFAGVSPLDVCVIHDAKGKPAYLLKGRAEAIAVEKNVKKCHLSISHDGGMAMAFCILEDEAEAKG